MSSSTRLISGLALAVSVAATSSVALATDPTVGTLPIKYEDPNGFGTFWWNQGGILNFEPVTSSADLNEFFQVHAGDWSTATAGAIDFARQFADCLADPGAPANLIVPTWRASVDYAVGLQDIANDLVDGIPNDPDAYKLVAKGYEAFALRLPQIDAAFAGTAPLFTSAAAEMYAISNDIQNDTAMSDPVVFLARFMDHGGLLLDISEEIRANTVNNTATGNATSHPFVGTTPFQTDVDIWFSVDVTPQLYAQGLTLGGVTDPNVSVYTELFQSNRTTTTVCKTALYASEWDRFFGIGGVPVSSTSTTVSSVVLEFASDPTVGTLPLIAGPGGHDDHYGIPGDC